MLGQPSVWGSYTLRYWHVTRQVSLQGLVGAGIYGVAVVALAADLTRRKGKFNSLMGIFGTALALGGVAGPLITGFLVQHLGFKSTFCAFVALATAGATVFTKMVPETGNKAGPAANAGVIHRQGGISLR